MDAVMRVGLLFNPTMISLPAPCVKYCAFMYDTTATPMLRIPTDKRERAVAILDYIMARREQELSRLALSVLYGTLQSLVPASPGYLGQTFLRRSYNILYADVDPTTVHVPTHIFYSKVALDDVTWADLEWWWPALRVEMCRPARYEKASRTGLRRRKRYGYRQDGDDCVRSILTVDGGLVPPRFLILFELEGTTDTLSDD